MLHRPLHTSTMIVYSKRIKESIIFVVMEPTEIGIQKIIFLRVTAIPGGGFEFAPYSCTIQQYFRKRTVIAHLKYVNFL